MHARALPAIFALALFASSQLSAQTSPQETSSITHVTVVDVATGKKLADQTVVLQGDRILSVSPADPATAPQGRIIDAYGGFLIPGLWDMHVHIQDLEDLPLYIANGVVGVRLMFGARDTRELRAKLSTAAAGPEVIFSSAIVDGDPPPSTAPAKASCGEALALKLHANQTIPRAIGCDLRESLGKFAAREAAPFSTGPRLLSRNRC
jgi:hypothetical protein